MKAYITLKRFLDVIGSVILIVILSPLFLVITLKLAFDGSLPFYCHDRVGFKGKNFRCLKFRSMFTNSQELLDQLIKTNPNAKIEWEQNRKIKNDPRVTPFGAFIRKTSIDELPQLLNVLIGDMSLVGPRPVTADELSRYGSLKNLYMTVRPGITGLWQVSGRNNVDYENRISLDEHYINNQSIRFDLIILFRTISVVISKNGAY